MTRWRTDRAGLRVRLRYRFDNALSRGPVIVIAYLGVLTLAVMLLAGLVATLLGLTFGDGDRNLGESAYQALLRMLDPGTFSGDAGWSLRALALAVTCIGIILGGSLIGLIVNDVDQRVDALRRGRGRVVERGHTLILGWSPHVPQIIAELVLANESERRATVVVLARGDKLQMDETLRETVPDTGSTHVVVRSGDPTMPRELDRVCARDARSIVVVRGPEGDASVVKAVLAVRALDPTHSACHVVAELEDDDDARTLRAVSGGRVVTVSNERVVAEVTAQACYQSGLAAVFGDLLDFAGDEFYVVDADDVVGWSYGEVQLAYEESSVVGRVSVDGRVELAPTRDTLIAQGDRLVVVASDDSSVRLTGQRAADPPAVDDAAETSDRPVRVLIVGWSHFGVRVLRELDEFLVSGSSIHVQVDRDLVDPAPLDSLELQNARLTVCSGRGGPEDLQALADQRFDQVILLGYRDALSTSDADARTLLSLLALRMIWPVAAEPHVRVVAELVDPRNVAIADPVGIDDLIVSDALASRMLAQVAQRAELSAVFEELFSPEGAVVVLLPAERLVAAGPLPFADVVAAVSSLGASAFGYRHGQSGQVVLNPPKSAPVPLRPGDHVIAIGTRTAGVPLPSASADRRSLARSSAHRLSAAR